MANAFDIQDKLRAVLQANAALSAWLQATFSARLTVMLGNHQFASIKPEHFPVAMIVFEPTSIEDTHSGDTAALVETYHIELGLHYIKDDTLDDTHLAHIAAFESLVGAALLADRRLDGLVQRLEISERLSDGNINHPFHFFSIKARVFRRSTY